LPSYEYGQEKVLSLDEKKIPKVSVITPTYKTSFQILSRPQNRDSSLNFWKSCNDSRSNP
jgi:hypothetical protein